MKTKNKIILSSLLGIICILGFLMSFYPDEKLQDQSDLMPTLQNIPQANNAYFQVENAKKNYQQPTVNPADMISFLTGKSSNNKIQNSDIDQFLASEKSSISLLEQAEQPPAYEDPKDSSIQTLDIAQVLPSSNPSTLNLIRTLYVKGLYELKENQATQGLQTIQDAMKLVAKMRKGSLTVIEYLIDHAALLQGKTILNYFADNGATTTTDVAAFTKTLIDDNWQDYINSLKFQFQTYKYMLDEATNKGNPFTQNHFNFRKNSTLNSLAKDQRDVISEAKDFNCNKPPVDESQNNQSEWPYLFQENGIGQAYLNAVAFKNPSQIFCNDAQKL